jgi:hypothetical protein
VKLLQQPDTAAGEFEGRTAAEAVRMARQVLGEDAAVRCWKTRRGGVAGFFAKEAFVAGVTPPEGAVKRVKVARPPRPRQARPEAEEAVAEAVAAVAPPASAELCEDMGESPTLAQLVEWTEDEVLLGPDSSAGDPFSEVLAEAQAAVNASRLERPEASRPTAAPLAPRSEPSPSSPVAGPERIDSLRAGLIGMGVPERYLPDEAACTYDGLARELAQLPTLATPCRPGSVIVVVGARREVHAAAEALQLSLGLKEGDVMVVDPTDGDRQRVARRRSAKKVTVVLVEASLRSRSIDAVAAWVDRVKPDHVLGAVSATAKRSDVASWRTQLGRVDALALFGLAATVTPGELMGELPIAFIDGAEASVLRWMLVLLSPVSESA